MLILKEEALSPFGCCDVWWCHQELLSQYDRNQSEEKINKQTEKNNPKKTAERWNQGSNLKSTPEVDIPVNSLVK